MPKKDKTIRLNDSRAAGRRTGLDVMRIAAMAAVVVLHVSGMKWGEVPAGSFEWHVLNLYDSLVQWAVPVFVMISGTLFLGLEKSIKQIYSKNLLRILTAFLFWSLLYASGMFFSGSSPSDIIRAFAGGAYHMWYLFMIAGLYMLVPLLRLIAADRKLMKYFLILSFVFAFAIPQIINLCSLRSEGLAAFMTETVGKFHLNYVIGFQFYFVLGYYLDNVEFSRKVETAVYVLGIVGYALTVCLTIAASSIKNEGSLLFYDSFSVNILLEAAAVYVFFKQRFDNLKRPTILVHTLARYCFGVYLVHAYFIYCFDARLGFGPLSFNPILAVPAVTVCVLIVSFLISAALNAIPVLRNYIV